MRRPWELKLEDLRLEGNDQKFFFGSLEAVTRKLRGESVQADEATVKQLTSRLPTKVREANIAYLGDVKITLTRLTS